MHCRMHDSTRVYVVEPFESEDARQSDHSNGKRHQVPEPKLELLVPSGNKLSTRDIANDHQLGREYLVAPSQLLRSAPFGIRNREHIHDAPGSAESSHKEEPKVDEHHHFLQSGHKSFGVINFTAHLVPKDGHILRCSVLALFVLNELGVFEVVPVVSHACGEPKEFGNWVEAQRRHDHELEGTDDSDTFEERREPMEIHDPSQKCGNHENSSRLDRYAQGQED